jgi:hypothetical protein
VCRSILRHKTPVKESQSGNSGRECLKFGHYDSGKITGG